MTTIKLDDGKYEFDIDDQTGLMTAARRHGEPWEAGFEQRFSNAFMAALWRVRDLEASAIQATRDSALALAECAQEGLRALSTAVQQSATPNTQADAAPPREAQTVADDSVLDWLETELSAISCRYNGDPSYDHDAYWMKDRTLKLIAEARKIFAAPAAASNGEQ